MANLGRRIGKIVGIVLASIVGLYLLFNGISWIGAQNTKSDVRDEITAQLKTAVPAAKTHQEQVVAAFKPLGSPDSEFLVQSCTFPTSDSGWMVNSYGQKCELRSVIVYPVTSIEQARQVVAAAPAELIGTPVEESRMSCPPLAESRDSMTRLKTGESAVRATFVEPQGDDQHWCGKSIGTTYEWQDQVVAGTPKALGPNQSWLVITRTQLLDQRDIGCLRWSILFCDNPFGDKPAFGTPPA